MVAPLDQTFRERWGRVLATLIGLLGDFDVAEEAAQEAFAKASERWPRDGVPDNPDAWLITTARNSAIDRLRREQTLRAKVKLLDEPPHPMPLSTRQPFPTSAWSCSLPVVIRRSRRSRRSR